MSVHSAARRRRHQLPTIHYQLFFEGETNMFTNLSVKKNHSLTLLAFLLLAVLLAACTPGTTQPGATQVGEQSGGITVVGRGEALGQPDQAEVQIGVETFAETVAEATGENEATIEALMAALEAEGIAADDIQTSNYGIWAEQRYGENGPEGIVGYRVTNQVAVTIRDIEKVGPVIAAATEAGANNVHGVSFSVADPAVLEAEARAEAIADAHARAASLADLNDVELGHVVDISEVIGRPMPLEGYGGGRMVEADAAPSISPGELTYNVEVQVTFAIR